MFSGLDSCELLAEISSLLLAEFTGEMSITLLLGLLFSLGGLACVSTVGFELLRLSESCIPIIPEELCMFCSRFILLRLFQNTFNTA